MSARFAPTTSGPAHPGTLVAGLLAWLDARSRGVEILLRLEDVDPTRCTPESADDMRAALAWFGLDWDREELQSANYFAHDAALDALAAAGALYPCTCSRTDIARGGTRALDGSWRYTGRCREKELPAGGWRAADAALRVRIPEGPIEVRDVGGTDLSQNVSETMGDPVVRRRDGAIAYHLAVVVDDARAGITCVVRGRDIAPSTATQVALQRLLGLPTPRYRHHFLLLEETGGKLAKLHGSVGWRELAWDHAGEELCGRLAEIAGLSPNAEPVAPRELVSTFDWVQVRKDDVVFR